PEGGHMVQGLAAKIAFKVTGTDGKGAACTGAVLDQKNDTVARFKTLRFGMGSFTFRPAPNTIYKAIIRIGSTIVNKDLGGISETGYVMQAAENAGNWNVTVKNA